mgnify:CR=1 FL=1
MGVGSVHLQLRSVLGEENNLSTQRRQRSVKAPSHDATTHLNSGTGSVPPWARDSELVRHSTRSITIRRY